jgi:hypothetical protein
VGGVLLAWQKFRKVGTSDGRSRAFSSYSSSLGALQWIINVSAPVFPYAKQKFKKGKHFKLFLQNRIDKPMQLKCLESCG